MSGQYVYAGAENSARIIRLNSGALIQITTAATEPVLLDAKTWEMYPGGAGGVCVFRRLVVRVWSSAGYSIRVTPSVDGTDLAAQDFTSASAGGDAVVAYVRARGSSVAVRVQQLTRTGDFELADIQVSYKIIRSAP